MVTAVGTRERPRLSAARQSWLIVVACSALALVVGSMAALYSAMSALAVEIGATQSQLTWIVDGYTLALACLVLPAGAWGDRWGRRALLLVGLSVFTIGSGMPLIFTSPEAVIAARVIAGVGAAMVMPSTLSLLTGLLPEERRSAVVGLWSGVAGAAGIAGIVAAGFVLEHFEWSAIFYVLMLLGAAALLAAVTLPESREATPPRLDAAGSVLVALGIGVFVLGVVEGPLRGWTDLAVLTALIGGAAVLAVFALWQLRNRAPLLDVRLFRDRGFTTGAVSLAVQFAVTFGMAMIVIQFFQLVLGYSPLTAALALAPIMVPMMVLAVVAPLIADRIGLRVVTVVGMGLVALGFVLLRDLSADWTYGQVLLPLLVMSSGLGLCSSPATAVILARTPADKQGVAAAVNDVTREVGAAIGIALSGSLIAAGYSAQIAPEIDRLPAQARGPVGDSLAGAIAVAEQAPEAMRSMADELVAGARDAFLVGAADASTVLAVATAVGAVAALLYAPGRPGRRRRPARRGGAHSAPAAGPAAGRAPADAPMDA